MDRDVKRDCAWLKALLTPCQWLVEGGKGNPTDIAIKPPKPSIAPASEPSSAKFRVAYRTPELAYMPDCRPSRRGVSLGGLKNSCDVAEHQEVAG